MFSQLFAQGATKAQPNMGISNILFMLAIFAIFYFLMIRPNIKKQKELDKKRRNLKKGDKIITSGGIIAKVEKIKDNNTLQVKINDTTTVDIVSSTIVEVLLEGDNKKEVKKKK